MRVILSAAERERVIEAAELTSMTYTEIARAFRITPSDVAAIAGKRPPGESSRGKSLRRLQRALLDGRVVVRRGASHVPEAALASGECTPQLAAQAGVEPQRVLWSRAKWRRLREAAAVARMWRRGEIRTKRLVKSSCSEAISSGLISSPLLASLRRYYGERHFPYRRRP